MKRQQQKLVTVGIPTYKRAQLVVKSIESCLGQDYPNIEIVVSDNASPDDTAAVIRSIGDKRIRYYRFDEPVEPYVNWNNCIRHASGEYMTMLSDDDLLDSNFLSTLVAEFEAHPDASLVRGCVRAIDTHGKKLWSYTDYPHIEKPEEFLVQRAKNRRPQFLPGFLFKTDVMKRLGSFEDNGMPAMLHLDDFLWFKLAFSGNAIVSSQKTFWSYRKHGEQYGGKLLDIGGFARSAIGYTKNLARFAASNECSGLALDFLRDSYLDSMLAHRIYHEERRMADLVKAGLSTERHKKSALDPEALLVIGNGPSIKGIDFSAFSDCPTLAINYSYKSWINGEWVPDYYLSNDPFHAVNDPAGLLELVNGRCKGKTKLFLLRKSVLSVYPQLSERGDIEFVENMNFYQKNPLAARIDSGGIGVLFGMQQGFSTIYTVGIDLLYSARGYEPTATTQSYFKADKRTVRMKGHYFANYYDVGYFARRPRQIETLITAWQSLRKQAERAGKCVVTTVRNSLLHGIIDYREYFNEPGYSPDTTVATQAAEVPVVVPSMAVTMPTAETTVSPSPNAYEIIKPMIKNCQPTTPGTEYPDYMRLEEDRSIPVDTNALRLFKDIHKGQRCFIVGNGPSLNKTDLSKLKDEITFGVNSIFLMTEMNGFIPTYYSVCDSHVIAENTEQIVGYPVQHKFFPSVFRKYIPPRNRSNVSFFMMNRGFNEVTSPNYAIPRFSADISERVYDGQTITYMNLQLAYFMGFKEVYLIGVDFNYVIPESAIIDGANILSTEDDPNHFHKDYFGKGRSWHDPVLHRVIKNYEFADMVFKWDGRQVFNATVGGKLEAFERADYYSLFG